ncbi:MAG: ABC transporter substrate-binding protein [Sarcina sp.]
MLKKLLIATLACISVVMVSCGTESKKVSEKKITSTKSVVDTYGRYVDVPEDISKVVVLNSGVYDLIKALDCEDKVVGITDTTKLFSDDTEKEIVGSWKEPNVEKILEIKPDVVFGYKKYMKEEVAKQIESAGIPIVYIDAYKVENMPTEISTLGTIFNVQDRASEYLGFLNKYNEVIIKRTGNIEEKDKVKVYWEGYTDYATVSKGTGGHSIIDLAGGFNVASGESVEYPKISDEWIIKNNPEAIIKVVSNSKNILGAGITDTKDAKAVFDSIVNRTGLNTVDAVKNNKTYVISSDIATSPQGSVIGSLYLAKYLYPEKFEDINPQEIHKEMLTKYYGTDTEGTWIYDGK